MAQATMRIEHSTNEGRGRSAASASFLAAKAELLGELDAMLQEEWAVAHPVEVAERRQFIAGLLGKAK